MISMSCKRQEAVQQAEDEARLESYLTGDDEELDFYWWCVARDEIEEAERIVRRAEQNEMKRQLDLFGRD
jgi:hypothetical protein